MKTKIKHLPGAVLLLLVIFGLTQSVTAQTNAPILFNTLTETDGNGTVVTPAQVCVVNPDGTNLRQLTTAKATSGGAAWHPGYQHFSFFRDGNLMIMPALTESKSVRPFAVGPAFPIGADFSPDGKKIVYCGPRLTDGKGICIIVRTVDAARRKVGAGTMVWLQDCYAPSFSPDGSKIAFSSHYTETPPGDGPHIKILDLPTGAVTSFDSIGGFIPTWSADGQWIGFCGKVETGSEIFVMRPDGTQLTQVTNLGIQGGVAWPSFSPAGDELVFTSGFEGTAALYNVSLSSGAVTLFQPSANAAHWTP